MTYCITHCIMPCCSIISVVSFCMLKTDSNISKMHIFKTAYGCLPACMMQCCIICNAYFSFLHFFKEGSNKQSAFHRRYPQLKLAMIQNLNLPTVCYSFANGPLLCQSVSNGAVCVIMWVLEIATDISPVCDPCPAGLWQSELGFEPTAGSTLPFPQLGSSDACKDQRLGASEKRVNTG